MAGFLVKQMVGNKISGVKGQLGSLGGGDEKDGAAAGEKTDTGEDPEVVQARLEAEERRKEKHRRMEAEREKMRQGIRDKYGIKKKEEIEDMMNEDCAGRIGATKRKTPEELAREGEIDDSLQGQLTSAAGKAKETLGGFVGTVKGFLPFGK